MRWIGGCNAAADCGGICTILCKISEPFCASQVYSTKQLEKPFECDVVDSFDNIEYTIEHGILVCTERQAFIDLLKDPKNEIQTLLEALGDYYFTHENSFDSLRLSAEQRSLLSKYENDAIHYWNY